MQAELHRVARIDVEFASGGLGACGSGYLVRTGVVVTAAHVVDGAASIRVRFDPDGDQDWSAGADVSFLDRDGDVAVLRLGPEADAHPVDDTPFGRVGDEAAVLSATAVGFPRFKLREAPERGPGVWIRDSAQVSASVPTLSNSREGTLEMVVDPPERDQDPDRSPWEGMSGAALWCEGRIIGLVRAHHRSDGLGRLAATRVDRWYRSVPAGPLTELVGLLGLPAEPDGLTDVIARTDDSILDYQYTVEGFAPAELVGREDELAELVRFCAGDEPYLWWRADPWSGKTALMAWFVLHPPVGVTVVSFFVTNRQAGQADSNSFHQNLVAQLAALAGVANPGEPLPGARDGQRRRLLAEAAAKVGGRGNRLVLVVDGLDEDRSNLALGQPSIASCLPDRLPAGVRVVVASRWHPDVPTDVDGHHPLRSCRQVRLAASEAAGDVKRLAEQELTARLQGADPVAYQIIAFLVASGGGLTTGELSELIDLPEANPPAVTGKLEGGDFSRSVVARASVEDGDKRYLLAHDTLREMAESQLGGDVDRYRDRLHSWADRYAASGWPESTPRYLFRPYGRMLAARSLTDRLVKLAGDQVRHDRMLEFTMGDGQALAEIDDAQLLLLAGPRYDFIAIADLAVHRFRLTQRNGAIPVFLPSVWAQVGEDTRGEALAGSITEPQMQAVALTQLVLAMVRAGRPPAAARIASDLERLARSITEPVQLAWALTGAAQALALTGSPAAEQAVSDAEQVATGLPDPAQRNWALAWVAQALAVVGGAARAQRIVATLAPADRDGAWLVVAQALAAVGDAGGAEQVAGAIDDPGRRMLALAAAAQTLIDSRDDKAADQAAAMADVARAVVDPQQRQWALYTAAVAHSWAGRSEEAERLIAEAEGVPDPPAPPASDATVGSPVGGAVTLGGELAPAQVGPAWPWTIPARAQALASTGQPARAEELARSITDPYQQAGALGGVAEALARVGQQEEAERVARSIANPYQQTTALTAVARAVALAGDTTGAVRLADSVEMLARGVSNPVQQVGSLVGAAQALAGAHQLDAAKRPAVAAGQIARSITDPFQQAVARAAAAQALAGAGLADEAEQTVGSINETFQQKEALAAVALALAGAGLADRAERAARAITDPFQQMLALAGIARALAGAGLADEAEKAAGAITDPYHQPIAMAGVAQALAVAGQAERAEQIARSLLTGVPPMQIIFIAQAIAAGGRGDLAEQLARSFGDPFLRSQALTALAQSLSTSGDKDGAARLADGADDEARLVEDTGLRAHALAAASLGLALSGQAERAGRAAELAEKLSEEIHDNGQRIVVLAAVAQALAAAEIGDRARSAAVAARQMCADLAEPDRQSGLVEAVAQALAATGLPDDAVQATSMITDPDQRVQALPMVAQVLVAAGHADQAWKLARSVIRDDVRVVLVGTVVQALAGAGSTEKAEDFCQRITDRYQQAMALATTAFASSATPTPGSNAARLCALVLAGPAWTMAFPVLARVDLSALLHITDLLLTDSSQRTGP